MAGDDKQPIGMYEDGLDAAKGLGHGCLIGILLWVVITAVLIALSWWYGILF